MIINTQGDKININKITIFNTPVLTILLLWGSKIFLKSIGWRLQGKIPLDHRFVMIAAPHTSNWDLPMMMTIAFAFKLKLFWLGKDTIFKFPFKNIMKWMGGIPIKREKSNNIVKQAVEIFDNNKTVALAISPEGTRKKVRCWKTGFYHIAYEAKVLIVLGFMDFGRKVGGTGGWVDPSGNFNKEIEEIKLFYKGIIGKKSTKTSKIGATEKANMNEMSYN